MKIASRGNPKQPSRWRGRSKQILLIPGGCEARKIPATGDVFSLTSPFIEQMLFRREQPRKYRSRPSEQHSGFQKPSPDFGTVLGTSIQRSNPSLQLRSDALPSEALCAERGYPTRIRSYPRPPEPLSLCASVSEAS